MHGRTTPDADPDMGWHGNCKVPLKDDVYIDAAGRKVVYASVGPEGKPAETGADAAGSRRRLRPSGGSLKERRKT